MSNDFFNHTARFVKLDTVRAGDVNQAFDAVSSGFDAVEVKTKAAIKMPDGEAPAVLPVSGARANKVLTFDADGKPVATYTIADVATVSAIAADVTTVAEIDDDVVTVAGNVTDISTVAGNNTNVTIVAMDIAHINAVADNEANIISVSENEANINTVACINANVATVAGISSNVTTVAENVAGVNTAATNIAAIIDAPNQAAAAATSATNAGNSESAAAASASAAAASAASIAGGPVPEAPSDGKQYARKDGAWEEVSGGSSVTLSGNTTLYVTQQIVLTITNYSSFSTYAVAASAGTVSRAGDQITYTAGASAGNVTLTVAVDGVASTFTIVVQPASVAAPTITYPANNATGIIETPTFTTAAFSANGIADTHLNTDWQLWTGAGRTGTKVWESLADASNKTSIALPAGKVSTSTDYYLSVRHRGTTPGSSAWTEHKYTTASTFNSYIATPTATPSNFGDPFEGGFYAGMYWDQIAQSSSSKTLATGTQAFTVPNMTGAPIVYAGQTLEVRSRANPANKFIGTVTGATGTTLTLNVSSIGGSGTFSDWSVMSRFRSIDAPKASGEHAGIALKNANTAFPAGCQTLVNGWAATEAMRLAGNSTEYPAAHWARNLNIGGYTDWHIPARDVLELRWRNLKPATNNNYVTADRPTGATPNYANNGAYGDTANTHGLNNNSSPTGAAYTASVPGQTANTAFRTGGAEAYEFGSAYYWSSTEYSAAHAWGQNWHSSGPGNQSYSNKSDTYRVRAVRRSII